MSSKPYRKVPSSLLQQNCFLRDVTVHSSAVESKSPSSYLSVDESVEIDGIRLKWSENPYPITPASVNSYVDSSDYRRDPASAIANAPKRVNLGDITELQDVDKMDMSDALELYQKLLAKISGSQPSGSQPSGSQPSGSQPSGSQPSGSQPSGSQPSGSTSSN